MNKSTGAVQLIGLCAWIGGMLATQVLAEDHASHAPTCRISLPASPHHISPEIYGMGNALYCVLTNSCVPLNRWGGNPTSCYNWKLGNAWNTGRDWFFENVTIENHAWQEFLRRAEASGGEALVSLPLLGFVAKDNQSYSFSVRKYGPQQQSAPSWPDAGNGVGLNGAPITGNDPHDAFVEAGPDFVAEWVRQMQHDFPQLFAEHRVLFAFDNEPMLWNVMHRDIHPNPVSYDEYLSRFIAMAHAVRQVATNAVITGPESWGWPAYFQSALDRETKSSRDRKQHGDEDFLPWFLKQMQAHEKATGERLLDMLTVHFYPQANGVYSKSASMETASLRLETVRSLYDPAYRDPSWIDSRVQLIPRLRLWVDQCYPGLKIGITEYAWGGEEDISGALALADVLGIFGRERLDLACYWTYPPMGSFAAQAYKMYRNVDGCGASFGDTLLDVTWITDADVRGKVSVYAARDESRHIVTVIIVNKSDHSKTLNLTFKDIAVSTGKGYSVSDHTTGIQSFENPPVVQGGGIETTLAPRSIYHFRFPEKP